MGQHSELPNASPLKVAFDDSACRRLRTIILRDEALFEDAAPAAADALLFGTDEIAYLRQSDNLRRYREKSLCITETDIPTFFMPGLYAANRSGALTRARTRTVPYLVSLEFNANEEIARLRDTDVPKEYLYSFMGGTNSWARRKILKYVEARADTIIEPTDAYNHWSKHEESVKLAAHRRYAKVLAASKFVLCPRGCGLSSYRLFETMSLGIAPVIIADGWQPIEGIDWGFALFIPERRIRDIDAIVRAHEGEWRERGRAARAAHEAFVSPANVARLVHREIADLLGRYSRRRETVMSRVARLRFACLRSYWSGVALAKPVVLEAFRLGDVPFPFALYGRQRLGPDRARDAR